MITLNKSRYEALECIGTGTTSRVERARDNVIGRIVALKTFIHSFGEDLEDQFLHEARLVGQLSHPAIVQLYDVGINHEGAPFLVMEYVAGTTLEEHLQSHSLTLQRACTWAADIARALGLAHSAGIIHGDIKTGNIFVTPEEKVKLGDFGIARLATQVSGCDRVKGTPAYLAPEQILGASQDQRSDQFSFGIVFYELLTGVRPFNGDTVGAVCSEILYAEPVQPSKRNPAVPPELDRVIARCLAKNPLERFDSFQQLVTFLYPYTRARRRTPAISTRKGSWWMRPSKHLEVWMVAAAGLLLTAFLQIPHTLRTHFGDVPAPPHSYYRPGVPLEASSYTKQTVSAEPQPESSDDTTPKKAGKKETQPRVIHSGKIALAALNHPGEAQNAPSNQPASVVHVAQLPARNQ